jgi:hypothetical protein
MNITILYKLWQYKKDSVEEGGRKAENPEHKRMRR